MFFKIVKKSSEQKFVKKSNKYWSLLFQIVYHGSDHRYSNTTVLTYIYSDHTSRLQVNMAASASEYGFI